MIRRAPMGDIWRAYDYGRGASDPIIFIQCINYREPTSHELWSHGLDGLSRDIQPTSQVEIPTGTVGELIKEYLTPNGRKNLTIGQYFVNRSIQFTGFTEIWGNSLPYIDHSSLPNTNIVRF